MESFLNDMGIHVELLYILWCDNLGTIQFPANPIYHSKIKHVAMDFQFVRERVEDKRLMVKHISISLNIPTKALRLKPFWELKYKLIDIYRQP